MTTWASAVFEGPDLTGDIDIGSNSNDELRAVSLEANGFPEIETKTRQNSDGSEDLTVRVTKSYLPRSAFIQGTMRLNLQGAKTLFGALGDAIQRVEANSDPS